MRGIERHSLGRRPAAIRLLLAALVLPTTLFAASAHAEETLRIERAWTRATVPAQKAAGGFLRLTNTSTQDDRLIAGSCLRAERVELHSMRLDGEVMRMRPVPAIPVPAAQATLLSPGGFHLMLIGLKAPLSAGEKVAVKLRFELAGEREVQLEVLPIDTPASQAH